VSPPKGAARGVAAGRSSKGRKGRKRARAVAPVVDLARERRIAGKVAELRDLLDGGAVDADRTRAMLAGELEARPVSDPDVSTTLRLPAALLARADELAARIPAPPGGRVSRSNVLRAALDRGLSGLEADAARATSTATPPDLSGVLAELDALRARVEALTAAPLSRLTPILSAMAHGPDPLSVACPTCPAAVGSPCLSGGRALDSVVGSPFLPSHPARLDAVAWP